MRLDRDLVCLRGYLGHNDGNNDKMTRTTTTTTTISQLWDLIETWCFHKDIININDKDKDNKDDKGISALGLDSKGHDFKKVIYV